MKRRHGKSTDIQFSMFYFCIIVIKGINTSVTVRKPQEIPPSGMPAKAKQNHVVVTVDNNAQFGDTTSAEPQQNGDANNVQLENNVRELIFQDK